MKEEFIWTPEPCATARQFHQQFVNMLNNSASFSQYGLVASMMEIGQGWRGGGGSKINLNNTDLEFQFSPFGDLTQTTDREMFDFVQMGSTSVQWYQYGGEHSWMPYASKVSIVRGVGGSIACIFRNHDNGLYNFDFDVYTGLDMDGNTKIYAGLGGNTFDVQTARQVGLYPMLNNNVFTDAMCLNNRIIDGVICDDQFILGSVGQLTLGESFQDQNGFKYICINNSNENSNTSSVLLRYE